MMATNKRRPVTFSLSPLVIRKLDRAAKVAGLSRSALAEHLMLDGLTQGDAMFAAMSNENVRKAFSVALSTPGVLSAIGASLGQELTERDRQLVLGFLKQAEAK
jgi:hypothetical protein